MSTGIGGDAFALVWQHGELTGLNASGRAPASADPDALGPRCRSRAAERDRAGRRRRLAGAARATRHAWGLDRCLADAIDAAERGFAVTPVIAACGTAAPPTSRRSTRRARVFLPAPAVGQHVAQSPSSPARCGGSPPKGPDGFYRGPVAAAIASATWLEESDLAAMQRRLGRAAAARPIGDATVCELPPNGQGAAALQAMGIAGDFDLGALGDADRVHVQAEAMKLAFADA